MDRQRALAGEWAGLILAGLGEAAGLLTQAL
jgi:hypothetical protein